MTTIDQKGKYGRYLYEILTLADLILINVVFGVIFFLVGDNIQLSDPKILWVMLNVSFNLSFGKQKKTQKQRIENADTDTGILSGTK